MSEIPDERDGNSDAETQTAIVRSCQGRRGDGSPAAIQTRFGRYDVGDSDGVPDETQMQIQTAISHGVKEGE
jgi:hypothetical protein